MKVNEFLSRVLVSGAIITILFATLTTNAQERIELFPFGDFESWSEQQIKESSLIGGETRTLYKIGGSWGSSNAHAKALGIDKVSVSVCPERRGDNWCCRMESKLEVVSAIGIDFKALATGSIFTGKMVDVVSMKQSTDPTSAINMGVPFTGRPSALILDYKAFIQNQNAVYAPAKTHVKNVNGHDAGQILLILQHRWEENGHVYAYRVGTAQQIVNRSTDWKNDFRIPVHYGKTGQLSNDFKMYNSKGQMVPIEEIDWREDVEPTHIIIQISAGNMPPFTGCPGNIMWCDNIRLAYAAH